jgi:hypothetical protein
MNLFKQLISPNRKETQLAYRVKYWPFKELSPAAKELIAYNKKVFLKKGTILDQCNEDKTKLFRGGREYQIVWEYNNMPTRQEWEGKTDNYLISCEFRGSAAIEGYSVVILSFGLPVRDLSLLD